MRVYINIERCSAGVSGGAATLSLAVRRIVRVKNSLNKENSDEKVGVQSYWDNILHGDRDRTGPADDNFSKSPASVTF